jgi:ectoine hydroxylase-related dioxygenase (phytanoyl-CoA dioxygenase family)
VIPRSHRAGKFAHRETYAADNLSNHGEVIDLDVDPAQAVDVTLRPGEMSVHHVNAIHGSNPNGASYARIGFSASYLRPDVPAGTMRVVRARGDVDPLPEPPPDDIEAGIASHAAYVRSHGRGLRLEP